MLSRRTRYALAPNALTLAIEARRARGAPFDDLTASNPTRVGLSPPEGALRLAVGAPGVGRYDPEPLGSFEAREAVAGYYAARGCPVDPARVALSASTSEAYGWLFKLLCDPGDEVLVARPGYPLFDELARLEGVSLVDFPLAYEGRWELDLATLRDAVTPRTRAVMLVHPNNPTGSLVSREARDALAELCAERGLALVVDEVFLDWAWDEGARPETFAGESRCLTFTLGGLSKALLLPQVKLAWTAVGGPADVRDEALARLELVADSYLSVSASAQLAARSLLPRRAELTAPGLARVRANLAGLRARVGAGSSATVLGAEAGWYAVLRVPATMTEDEWVLALLDDARALVQPGWFYDFARGAHLVVSLLPEPDVFAAAIDRVVARVDRA
ncbi:MAG: pyridoxal phosphate-dependent aminotransferase [Polyangiales bacterium]